MAGLARTLRLMIGLVLVAAGTTLAAPAGLAVAVWWRSAGPPLPAGDGAHRSLATAPLTALPGFTEAPAPAAGGFPDPFVAAAPGSDRPPPAPHQPAYLPPPPPAPLPGLDPGLAAAGPDLSSHYRTTLAPPPPPLIDGQRPPPLAVGWAPRGATSTAPPVVSSSTPPAATYRVRDGDDLTGIAIRFYGTPAAANAIWEANQGILSDPGLLPIGVELRLPAPDAVDTAVGRSRRRSIEPVTGRPAPITPPSPPPAAAWLGRG